MFPEMRRTERQLTDADTVAILEKGEYGILSTVGENGYPYGVPVSYAYKDGVIYFHCAKDAGQKTANLAVNPKICFTVVGDTELLPDKFSTKYESVVAFGLAQEAEDPKEGLLLLVEKYSPNFMAEGKAYIERSSHKAAIYELHIEHMTAKGRRER